MVPNAKNGELGGGIEATLKALNNHSTIVESIAMVFA